MPEATEKKSPQTVLSEMMWGYRLSQAIFVAIRLHIIDLLKQQTRSNEELAAAAQVDPQALHRLLMVLVHAGLVCEADRARFALTEMGALLHKGEGLRDSAVLAELYWPAYGELLHAMQTGRSGFERAFGMPIYDYLAKNAEADAAYEARMTAATGTIATALMGSYDFSGLDTVVDVGGGRGALLSAILKAHRHLRGILFDRPAVVAGVQEALAAEQVGERGKVVGGDFFEGLPAGGDAYILKWVLSEWSDEQATAILRKCRKAMSSRGRVLVIDPLDLPSNELFNLQMLVVWNGGRVRSRSELASLFAAAGLDAPRIVPTQSQFAIVEGRPT